MTLGKRIQKERREAGYTQESLAKVLGVGGAHISKIEADRERPSIELLIAIADLLSIDADVLIIASGRVPQRFVDQWAEDPERAVKFLTKWKGR